MTVVSAFLWVLLVLFVSLSLLVLALSVRVSRSLPAPLLSWQSRHTLHLVALPVAGVAAGLALSVMALEFGYVAQAWSGLVLALGALCWVFSLTLMHRIRVYEEGLVMHAWNPEGYLLWSDVHDYMKVVRGATRFTFFSGRVPQRRRVDVLVPGAHVPELDRLLEHTLDARYDVARALRVPASAKPQSR